MFARAVFRHQGENFGPLNSANAHNLVGLKTQIPLRMPEAIFDGAPRILRGIRAIHRLEREMLKR
jgi:hypothetical protein